MYLLGSNLCAMSPFLRFACPQCSDVDLINVYRTFVWPSRNRNILFLKYNFADILSQRTIANFPAATYKRLLSLQFMRIALSRSLSSLCSPKAFRFPSSAFSSTLSSHLFRCREYSRMAAKPTDFEFNRQDLEDLLKRRFFLSRSFDIYGGVAGL